MSPTTALFSIQVSALFSAADTDGSNDIDPDELTAILSTKVGDGASRLVAKQMIALADVDESGTVDRAELAALMRKVAAGQSWK